MRTIILHYHLFKNAGTSLDAVLQQNFGDRWVTQEFTGQNNTKDVEAWIKENPKAIAFSSHTMLGPLPSIEDTRILSIMLLRDPLERIRSAYRFEMKQQADTFGAVLAKHTDFEGYVKVRLALPRDRQCRNFQTHRLASLVPGPASELERAKDALTHLSVTGLVSDFSGTLARLTEVVRPYYPKFASSEVQRNTSVGCDDRNEALENLLHECNSDDRAILEYVAESWKEHQLGQSA